MISVLLVDDHPIVREGLCAILSDQQEMRVVGSASSADEALQLAPALMPNIAVLDVRLPGMGGVELCAELRHRVPSIGVVMLTSFPTEGVMLDALEAGAKGFTVKESDPATLRHAITVVANGGSYIDPRLTPRLTTAAKRGRRTRGPFDLTLQELRVLELLPRGLTNRAIGARLGVSEQTVKTHLSHAMAKLNVRDRAQATAVAMREGLA
jgi:DNA-binding NarL/FixJ family response regulator